MTFGCCRFFYKGMPVSRWYDNMATGFTGVHMGGVDA